MSPYVQQALPAYLQIANDLRDRIVRGELKPGDEVPSERRLAEEWKVARLTAGKAVAVLRTWGLVETRQGSGTFVRSRPPFYRRTHDPYLQARATGLNLAPGEYTEMLAAGAAAATEGVAEALGIQPGQTAIRRRRLLIDVTGSPAEISASWFRQELEKVAPRLLEKDRILEGTLAYVQRVTGRNARMGRDQFTARLAVDDEAALLRLGDGPVPVLLVHHIVYDERGDPLEFAEAVSPPGRWLGEDYPL